MTPSAEGNTDESGDAAPALQPESSLPFAGVAGEPLDDDALSPPSELGSGLVVVPLLLAVDGWGVPVQPAIGMCVQPAVAEHESVVQASPSSQLPQLVQDEAPAAA